MTGRSTENQRILAFFRFFAAYALVILPILLGGLTLSTATGSLAGDLPTERLRAIVDAAVAKGVPGIVVRVETRDGEVWSGASGLARIDSRTDMTSDDVFRVFSISKMATAAAALTLVDDGALGLDDPIGQWLEPELIASIPNADAISVGDLIAQTSGIRDYFDDRFAEMIQRDPGRRWEPAELVKLATEGTPAAAPGSDASHYSNTNYVLLGLIVEQATNMPLADVLRARLLDPLGMVDTHSAEEAGAAISVAGYLPIDGALVDVSGADLSIAWAAGSLISTAEDVARLTRGLFEDDLLSPESRALMTNSFEPLAGTPADYGYGTILFKQIDPAPIGHTGEGPGFGALTAWWPQSGTIVVVLTNIQAEAHLAVLAEIAASLGG
ncbi:MAG: beta-lactamase family protein [Hyphomicrobiales bacterium]|nr:beta-lactamase family protein [Hyphomicrobiales bacterium]